MPPPLSPPIAPLDSDIAALFFAMMMPLCLLPPLPTYAAIASLTPLLCLRANAFR